MLKTSWLAAAAARGIEPDHGALLQRHRARWSLENWSATPREVLLIASPIW